MSQSSGLRPCRRHPFHRCLCWGEDNQRDTDDDQRRYVAHQMAAFAHVSKLPGSWRLRGYVQRVTTLAENSVDVVVLDYMLPEMDGLAVAMAIREHHEQRPILLLTGYPKVPKELLEIVNGCVRKGQAAGVQH